LGESGKPYGGVRVWNDQLPHRAASGYRDELLNLWKDPAIRRFAQFRAGCPELAEDALQEVFYSLDRVKQPERIENLRAFFRKTLVREIEHQRRQLGPRPVESPETAAGYRREIILWADPADREVDKKAVMAVLAETWLTRFRHEREQLAAKVPDRSARPDCYRSAIVGAAEEILRSLVAGSVSSADCNEALQAALPGWFDAPGCSEHNRYQRLSRARQDTWTLLKSVINRADLSP
jgi:DNA-directed RNA polymerase specialized sigma24 family protein